MALVVKDRVKEITTTTGTGTYTLGGASTGFQSFSVIGNGNTTYYAVTDNINWEVGIGTYTSSGTTLSRDTILASSNGGSAVNWSAGTKDVFVTYPASRSVYTDAAGSAITPSTASVLGVASGGTGQSSYINGQLLIGNSTGNTLTKSTLTAGTGISITNGSGSITVAATNNGDVVGPASSTDNAVVRYDGTTGKVVQNSSVTIDDSNNVGGLANLNFSGTGNRITGDFSNATIADRLIFQTSTTNDNTTIEAIPNGTGTSARWTAYGNSDPTNASFLQIGVNATPVGIIISGRRGTGSYLPMTFQTNGFERVRIDTSGNVGIGTDVPSIYGVLSVFGDNGNGTARFLHPGNNSFGTVVTLETYSGTDSPALSFKNYNAGSPVYYSISTNASGDLLFNAGGYSGAFGNERARITSSGNVGIGTGSPLQRFNAVNTSITGGGPASSGSAADPNAVSRFQAGAVVMDFGVYPAGPMWIQNRAASNYAVNYNLILQPNGGSVGIGTSAVLGKFNVGGGRSFFGANSELYSIGVGYTQARVNSGQVYYLGASDAATPDLVFSNATGTEKMRLTYAGNLGIGTSAPGSYGTLASVGENAYTAALVAVSNSSGASWARIDLKHQGVANPAILYFDQTGAFGIRNEYNGPIVFFTNGGNERMRIDSSGNLLVGTTSVPTNGSSGVGAATFAERINVRAITCHAGLNGAYQGHSFNIYWTGSAARLWIDTTDLGSIQLSSDYRVKKDVQTQATDALSRIAKIRPVTYTYADYEPFSWKADGVLREGFIAHELAEVIPSAVEGEKDAPNQIQSLKVDALCSVLVKAIQEQQAIIEQLTQRVAALEGA